MQYSQVENPQRTSDDKGPSRDRDIVKETSDSDISYEHDIVTQQRRIPRNGASASLLRQAPFEMSIVLVLGTAGALAHFLYYRSLDRQAVDSTSISQEWNVRIGTGLAFLAKTCWTFAILIAHQQRVWYGMERKSLHVKTIDAMIYAPSDLTKLAQFHLLRHAKVATIMAIAAWCVPLSAVFTPSTLTVVSTVQTQDVIERVPTLDLNNATKFASMTDQVARELNVDKLKDPVLFRYATPRTAVQVVATASKGEIQEMSPHYANSSYSQSFYGPSIGCDNGTDRISEWAEYIYSSDPFFDGYMGLKYWAFVPSMLSNGTRRALDWKQLPQAKNPNRFMLMTPSAPEIWINTDGADCVCALYNASYHLDVIFTNGKQEIKPKVETLNKLNWTTILPKSTGFDDVGNQAFAYQAIWMALARQLVGSIVDNPIDTNVMQTSIMSSVDMVAFFDGESEQPFSSNKTIAQMIEQLSVNITLSLLSSQAHLAEQGQSVTISVSNTLNVYNFNRSTLLLSYGIALVVTLVAGAIGLLAYRANGGSRSLTYSALVEAVYDKSLNVVTRSGQDSLIQGERALTGRVGTGYS